MSDVEKSRKATEFQSVTEADSPPEDTDENMDDEVFSNNESTNQQKNQGDKKTVPDSSTPSPPPEKRPRGRPRTCRSLDSLRSIPDPDKKCKPPKAQSKGKTYPCSVCKENVPFGKYSVQCNVCFLWVHLNCSKLQNVNEHNSDYSCPVCKNTTENIPVTTKSSRFRLLSSVSSVNQNKRSNVKRKRDDDSAPDKNSASDKISSADKKKKEPEQEQKEE